MFTTLGIDTSNYTTSAALCTDGEIVSNCKRLLPVADGELGLRQSDAVFAHVKQIDEIISAALNGFNGNISAIGVSTRPRDREDSYMPCFNVGKCVAHSMAAALNVPVYHYSHQQGHIAAALYSSGRLDLRDRDFLAFHVSGGTTEALYVHPGIKCEIVSKSLDLKIGQAVDRVGKMLSLSFPSGAALDALAQSGEYVGKINVKLIGDDCSVSGLENKCAALYKSGEKPENIAAFLFKYITALIDKMTENLLKRYGTLPVVYSGGVMSNSVVRREITKKYDAYFSDPAFSSDNAAGLAILASGEKR